MEEFLIFNLIVGLLVGFIIALTSRGRYKKRCRSLQQEIYRLQDMLRTSQGSVGNSINNINILAKQDVPAPAPKPVQAPNTQPMVQQGVTGAQPAVVTQAPVTPVPVQQPVVVSKPVAVAPAPQVAKVPTVQSVAESGNKINAVGISLAVGILLLIISAAVFITATWYTIDMIVKAIILLGVIAVVWAMSFVATKVVKLPKIGSAFYILGTCLAPLDAAAFMLEIDFPSVALPIAICAATVAICGFVGYKIFKSKLQLGVSVFALAWVIIFLTITFVDGVAGFVLGFAIVMALFLAISEFLPEFKTFVIASEVIAACSAVVFFISGFSSVLGSRPNSIISFVAFVMINAMMIWYMRRHDFLKYVVPIFTAMAIAFSIFFMDELDHSSVTLHYVIIAISIVLMIAYVIGMKLLKIPTWLTNGLVSLVSFVPILYVYDVIDNNIARGALYIVLSSLVPLACYVISKTKVEKGIYALWASIGFAVSLAVMCEDYEFTFVAIIFAVALALCALSAITKKMPFIYESMLAVSLIAMYDRFFDSSWPFIVISIFYFVLLASVPVWAFFRYKKSMVRDIIISVSAAIACGSVIGILYEILYYGASLEYPKFDEVMALCSLIYAILVYTFAVVVIKIKKINAIAWDVFKYIAVAGLTLAFIIFSALVNGTNTGLVRPWMLLVTAVVAAVVSIFEDRNYATFIPGIMIVEATYFLVEKAEFIDGLVFLFAIVLVFALTLAGRFINPKVISKNKGIDWLTLSSIFVLSFLDLISENEMFFGFMMLAVIAVSFIGRFYKEEEGMDTSIKDRILYSIRPILSVAILFIALGFAAADFINYGSLEEYKFEICFSYILIAAALIAFVIRLPKIGKWVWFAALAIFTICEGLYAIVDGGNVRLIIIALLGIGIFVISFVIKNKSWFLLGIQTLAGIGLYLAITYWDSKLWWAYLLFAGLLLIGTATTAEIKKRSEKAKMEVAVARGEEYFKHKRFENWVW